MLLKLKKMSLKNVICCFHISIAVLGSNSSNTQSPCLTLYVRISLAEPVEPGSCIKSSCVATSRLMALHSFAGFTTQNVPAGVRDIPDLVSDAFQPQHVPTPATSEMVIRARTTGPATSTMQI